ncbi:microtubule-associated protein futsch-like [Etheostoma cragini]|uniref:microtubule-associated protein futsch-like n=1 Tax=Etheostoma cragini TaxID=417921 RepID=UPI00155DF0BC|nr:microtubule-associated protein futsch-like [Etheostoma cragini]
MALCRLPEEQLLMGVAQLDIRGGGVNPFIERLAELGLPEDEGEYEEGRYEEVEYEIVVADEDEHSPDEEDDDQLFDSDQDEDDDTGDEDDWSDSFSHDSGYDSLSEEEEDEEDEEDVEEDVEEVVEEDDDGNIRPCSPLIQQFPAPIFWQRWEQVSPTVPAGAIIWPRACDVQHLEIPAHQVEHAEDGLPSASQRSKESAPSTSGLGSSTKRSREESDTLQVSMKKQKWNCEDSHDESASSTSGLGFSTKRSREEDVEECDDGKIRPFSPLIQQFPAPIFWQRWDQVSPTVPAGAIIWPRACDVQHLEIPAHQVEHAEDGLPSASQRSTVSAPSTSGLGSSTKRSREESDTLQVSMKRQKWNCEDSHDESAPSTSGLGFYRSREDSHRELAPPGEDGLPSASQRSKESAPSTLGLGSSTKRSREESETVQVSTKKQKWNCDHSHNESAALASGLGSYRRREDNYRESAPSTSGLSSNRSRGDSYRESAPSTSGLSSNRSRGDSYRESAPSPFRKYWMGPFDYLRRTEDCDSD